MSLKGVGPYTAAAIASFAFNENKAVVDGNVYRVLSRIFDISTPIDTNSGQKIFQNLADELITANDPALHNQAIMEFGALQCTPKKPDCENCPMNHKCLALKNNTISERPLKSKKTKVRKRYFNYLIFSNEQEVVLEKRTQKDIWQHLYEFPLVESLGEDINGTIEEISSIFDQKPHKVSDSMKHVLSHQHVYCRFYHFDNIPLKLQSKKILKEDIENYPLPRLIDRYLENHGY